MLLQKLSWFPGKILSSQERKRAREEAWAEEYVQCHNSQFGSQWRLSFLQIHGEHDVTDVTISSPEGEKHLQLVHGDVAFEEARPKLLKGYAVTRWVEDESFVTDQICFAIEEKINKYQNGANGITLLIHGGPLDHLPTIEKACKTAKLKYTTKNIYFDEIWYLYHPSNRIIESRILKIK